MFTLEKDAGREFTVLNLSDMQIWEENWTVDGERSRSVVKTIEALMERVRPDLVTVSGDISYGDALEAYEYFCGFMDSFGVPWAPVLGNHDHSCGPERDREIAGVFRKSRFCLFEEGDPAIGCGNYVIRITENGRPVEGFIMIDSHNMTRYVGPDGKEAKEYDRLWPDQLGWYLDRVAELKAEGCNDTTVIMHIPPNFFRELWNIATQDDFEFRDMSIDDCTGIRWWKKDFLGAFGMRHEGICCYPEEDGTAAALIGSGSTHHLIVGHDHANNYVIPYAGITWIYTMKTGRSSYWDPDLNGGTVLTVGSSGVTSVRHEFVSPSVFSAES